MPMNAGDFDVTTGLAKRIYDRWTGASPAPGQAEHEGGRNGFASPLPGVTPNILKSQIYSFASEVVAEITNNLRATMVLDQRPGPLPVTSTAFDTRGGTLLVLFGGSAGSSGAGLVQRIDLGIDGVVRGSTSLFFSQATTHQSFPSRALVVAGIPAGSHTLSLETTGSTDDDDAFSATVVELPF